jgi:hypothetical protein
MAYINRDPFARNELHKETVLIVSSLGRRASCAWCGQVKETRRGHPFLFQYRQESDGGRNRDIPGLFCSVDCMRNYHGLRKGQW